MFHQAMPSTRIVLGVAVALTLVASATEARAQGSPSSYSVWSRQCPAAWRLEQVVNTYQEAQYWQADGRQQYPSKYWAIVPNYNGSRNPPTTNPCAGGGGGGSGGHQCYGLLNYPVYLIVQSRTQRIYGAYCCPKNRDAAYYQNYIWLRNNGYMYSTAYVSWYTDPACSKTAYTCINGVVYRVPNNGSYATGGWGCR
jgi:hypothetical protein